MVEVTAYSAVKPPAEILSAPKACIDAANAPPAELTRYAQETGGEATIYRQCTFPQTVLLMVLKNPANCGEGADWI